MHTPQFQFASSKLSLLSESSGRGRRDHECLGIQFLLSCDDVTVCTEP